VLVYPSTLITAVPLRTHHGQPGGHSTGLFETATRNTELASMLGHAMISLPLPVSAGALPVGLTFEGLPHWDRHLLATAARAEATFGVDRTAASRTTISRRRG
jgi:Asp-tRNA(Asn)/Glu-tRNA(Gln) amidotransferase A subunit family amidase